MQRRKVSRWSTPWWGSLLQGSEMKSLLITWFYNKQTSKYCLEWTWNLLILPHTRMRTYMRSAGAEFKKASSQQHTKRTSITSNTWFYLDNPSFLPFFWWAVLWRWPGVRWTRRSRGPASPALPAGYQPRSPVWRRRSCPGQGKCSSCCSV